MRKAQGALGWWPSMDGVIGFVLWACLLGFVLLLNVLAGGQGLRGWK